MKKFIMLIIIVSLIVFFSIFYPHSSPIYFTRGTPIPQSWFCIKVGGKSIKEGVGFFGADCVLSQGHLYFKKKDFNGYFIDLNGLIEKYKHDDITIASTAATPVFVDVTKTYDQ